MVYVHIETWCTVHITLNLWNVFVKTEFPVSFFSINYADNTWGKTAKQVAQPTPNIDLATYFHCRFQSYSTHLEFFKFWVMRYFETVFWFPKCLKISHSSWCTTRILLTMITLLNSFHFNLGLYIPLWIYKKGKVIHNLSFTTQIFIMKFEFVLQVSALFRAIIRR